MEYSEKIKQLFQLGNVDELNSTHVYDEIGFETSDIPELIQLGTDTSLLNSSPNEKKNWAPVHAWHVLAKMKATEAMGKLVELFHRLEDNHHVDEELPEIFAQFGTPALPLLEKYVKNADHGTGARATAAACIKEIGKWHTELRKRCVDFLTAQIKKFEGNDAEFNGFLIWYLTDLQAKESFSVIKEAFKRNCVDKTLVGDVSNIEYQLKLTDKVPQVQIFAEESLEDNDTDEKNL
ncbi:hypothetical protein B6D60_03435 [candidate division KSB1 bacterium 4484_87]|nr:MAG: hypothetical protein B6D60_03435 [candidate division KSB1 bacterium 4484_87]